MFKYTLDNKRYHTFNYFLKNKFGCKVYKIPLDAHTTCPNKKTGGCIYCKENSKANITDSNLSLLEQYQKEVKILNQKWPNAKHIIYFQTGTNTNIPIQDFINSVETFLKIPNIVGIAIATRPDCLNEDYYHYFSILNQQTFLTIEIGLQTSNDDTLKLINRGHNVDCFVNTIKKLKELNIFTVVHIINGLPYETKDDMLNTVGSLNDLEIDGIKIHMLHILKDTPLAKMYEKEHFPILSKEEYIDIVISQLELLNEKIVIERITGDPIIEDLITPTWLTKKFILLNDIDKEMVKRDIYQGDKFNS
jgi:radical SAM protein (TIGR01212 family)